VRRTARVGLPWDNNRRGWEGHSHPEGVDRSGDEMRTSRQGESVPAAMLPTAGPSTIVGFDEEARRCRATP
jgi:hypothetical protein